MTDIQRGIDLFNDADFFSAHDYFEDHWMNCNRSDRLFYQGMVQISVGCYHLLCTNYKGSLSQFSKGTDKLKNYLPNYLGVNVERLVSEVDLLKYSLSESKDDQPKINIDEMPKIEYKKLLNNK